MIRRTLLTTILSLPVLIFFTVSPASAGDRRWELPDAATGQINGQPAILFWPVRADTNELVDPTDCEVHARPRGQTTELRFPCGDWFVPPVGGYIGWVEGEKWISASPLIFSFGGGPFQGSGSRVLAPVVPAGRLCVFVDGNVKPTDSIRFLSLDGSGHALERRATVDEARRGIRMPARRAVAGLFAENDDALIFSRPIAIRAGDTTNLKLARPQAATVLTILERPATARGRSRAAVKLTLDTPAGAREPDFFVDTPARLFAGWYDIPPSAATLRLVSDELRLDPLPLHLSKGSVATIRRTIGFAKGE